MVEQHDLGVKTSLLDSRAEDLDELELILPRHVQRHGVTMIQRLVLHCHSIDIEAFSLHCLDPLHEILCIVIVA